MSPWLYAGGGVEVLTNCMNEYFTRVINMILAFDGDVVKFAGDSMIVVFSPTAGEQQAPDLGLHAATERGLRCAHVLATRLGHMRMKMNGHVSACCSCWATC
jgi:class 3 adenylate cyclase